MRGYISVDYNPNGGDRDVAEMLRRWSEDGPHAISFVDTAEVLSKSVASKPDCCTCDLKLEFNKQINASSFVIFVVGDKTRTRASGIGCGYATSPDPCATCTPFKKNMNGRRYCKMPFFDVRGEDIDPINRFSYLRHEFEQAKLQRKNIIIVFNSTRYERSWLPFYMKGYEGYAFPFWIITALGQTGNYPLLNNAIMR